MLQPVVEGEQCLHLVRIPTKDEASALGPFSCGCLKSVHYIIGLVGFHLAYNGFLRVRDACCSRT